MDGTANPDRNRDERVASCPRRSVGVRPDRDVIETGEGYGSVCSLEIGGYSAAPHDAPVACVILCKELCRAVTNKPIMPLDDQLLWGEAGFQAMAGRSRRRRRDRRPCRGDPFGARRTRARDRFPGGSAPRFGGRRAVRYPPRSSISRRRSLQPWLTPRPLRPSRRSPSPATSTCGIWPTASGFCRWTPCSRPRAAIPARRWAWPTSRPFSSRISCSSTRPIRIGSTATASCCRTATPRCCSTACCT